MTFDEAIEMMENLAGKDSTEVWFEKENFIELINDLRETYTPTVELTKEQFSQLQTAKELTTLMSLCYELINSHHPLYNSLYSLKDADLVNAWLHPESIKIVG